MVFDRQDSNKMKNLSASTGSLTRPFRFFPRSCCRDDGFCVVNRGESQLIQGSCSSHDKVRFNHLFGSGSLQKNINWVQLSTNIAEMARLSNMDAWEDLNNPKEKKGDLNPCEPMWDAKISSQILQLRIARRSEELYQDENKPETCTSHLHSLLHFASAGRTKQAGPYMTRYDKCPSFTSSGHQC